MPKLPSSYLRAARVVAALAVAATLAVPASLVAAPAASASLATSAAPPPPPGIPAPGVAAAAHLLVDVTSGQTLTSAHADERRDPASLTKLMTAYIVFEALRAKTIVPSQMVNVSQRAWKAEGSRMFIEPRRAVSVDELVKGMIVQSGNDASIALAELVAGSEEAFVAKMNAEAARLGMTETHYTNATGLSDPQHYTTAADLARIAIAVIRDFPEYYPVYSQKEFRYNNITQPNRNRLLWTDPYVDGMKTGHTEAAGWCLIATAKRGDRRVLAVILGAASDAARTAEAQKILNWGFQAFDTVQLYASGKQVTTIKVWKGALAEVPAGFLVDRYLTLPKGKNDKLAVTMQADEPLMAPVARGQRVGTVKIALEGTPMAEFPLIALDEVPLASFLGRAWDTVRLWFKR
ncbi:MAG: D-alanyl-D-alanine carboxypeptidase [Burkholderiales bacterium]|nr:D-alanyl-D-alanine carboxypeptidase [Burkholderiales bacterium]